MALQEITDVILRHKEAGEITGGIVLVAHKGDIVYLEALGTADQEPKTALSTETIFWMASMTKPYVAAAIMLLLEENWLRLDDLVARYIPEFGKPRQVRTLKPGSPPIPPFHGGPPDPNVPPLPFSRSASSTHLR